MSTLSQLMQLSDLTLALAAAGGVVLAGVIAHGVWSTRKAGPKRADAPSPLDSPAAMVEQVEPVFGDEPAGSSPPPEIWSPTEPAVDGAGLPPPVNRLPVGATQPTRSASDAAASSLPAQPPSRPARRSVPRIDALIDAIATLKLEAPVNGDAVLPQLPPSRRAGAKPLLIEGLNAASGEWEPPSAGQRYGELQAGVQLANRGGALNEIEYSEFVQKVQALADGIGALADFPDMLEVVGRARELDAFAGGHDAQLAVHLRARDAAWSIGYLQQHASRHGFVAGGLPGRLVLPAAANSGEGAPPVLTLTFDAQAALADDPNQAALRDVTLAFDVPQTDPQAQPFAAWQASAQALALGMDAAIIDDAGRPLTPQGFDVIGGELQQLYDALAERDVAAGSAAARRLFS